MVLNGWFGTGRLFHLGKLGIVGTGVPIPLEKGRRSGEDMSFAASVHHPEYRGPRKFMKD